MNLVYHSTRNSEETATASEAILKGLTSDGGLFVPDSIPKLNVSLEDLTQMSYQEIAYAVMKEFLTDFTEEELKTCINNAYDSKFDTEEIAVTKKVDGAYYLELFRRYRKSCPGRLCRCTGNKDHRILSKVWSQPNSGKTDGNTEG